MLEPICSRQPEKNSDECCADSQGPVVCYNALKMELALPWNGNQQPVTSTSKAATGTILPRTNVPCPENLTTTTTSRSSSPSSFRPSVTFHMACNHDKSKDTFLSASSYSHSLFSPDESVKRPTCSSPDSPKSLQPDDCKLLRPEQPARSVKRPSSLPIPSQMRASRRPCTLSIDRAHLTETSPLSASSLKAFSSLMQNSAAESTGKSSDFLSGMDFPASTWQPMPISDIGLREPVWAPDNAFSACMICAISFTLIRRRHHCRACGRLLCATCCNRRIRLPFTCRPPASTRCCDETQQFIDAQHKSKVDGIRSHAQFLFSNRPARVCSECFELLNKPDPFHSSLKTSYQPPSPKRQRSVAPLIPSEDALVPVQFIPQCHLKSQPFAFLTDRTNITLAYGKRCDPLLYPLQPSGLGDDPGESNCWPPLVISVHAALVLQYNPSPELLISLLTFRNQPVTQQASNAVDKSLTTESLTSTSQSLETIRTDTYTQEQCAETSSVIPPGVTLALTRNVHLHVHATELTCCANQSAWCFSSRGLDAFGQDEIVLLVKRRSGTQLPPLSVYHYFQLLYLAIIGDPPRCAFSDTIALNPFIGDSAGRFAPLDHFFGCHTGQPSEASSLTNHFVRDSGRSISVLEDTWLGCIFFRPTHQCLAGLRLPTGPLLFGLLVHRDEMFWARELPLRLLLRLGKSVRHYPTTLLSDRDRQPVFNSSSGTSILQLLDELGGVQKVPLGGYTNLGASLRTVCRLKEAKICLRSSCVATHGANLSIVLPVNIRKKLTQFLNQMPKTFTVFTLAGGLDVSADSHLVCVQPSAAPGSVVGTPNVERSGHLPYSERSKEDYITEAISIENTQRQVTGATFVMFSSSTGSQFAVRIIEDGLLVELPSESFTLLTDRLQAGQDFCCPDHLGNDSNRTVDSKQSMNNSVASLTVRWIANEDSCSTVELIHSPHISWIDTQVLSPTKTYLVPVHYQLAHWLRASAGCRTSGTACKVSDSVRLAWTRVHLISASDILAFDKRTNQLLCWPRLADQAAGALTESLCPHLEQLRSGNHTRVALRIRLQPPDNVGYQLSSVTSDLGVAGPSIATPLENLTTFSTELDSNLLPVLQIWIRFVRCQSSNKELDDATSSLSDTATFTLELDFYVLD
ncbi:MAD, mothers against decapentaplegic interacting protein [Paragonimus westermani]|uniref:MAD, mothers against decapentaplegic interacting protein n=1 Tax=Paragonimus westermani TaxID=34504 RepID=A0A5J4NDB0_9TREM|nr:MAD, mothers against decapentaplegic interacting protein [Paragonimus westermani]